MNRQTTYNTVARHLRQQGHRAGVINADNNFCCRYKTPSGESGAIGCLIPDQLYDTEFEGLGIRNVLCDFPQIKYFLKVTSVDDEDFLEELQEAHDANETWAATKRALRDIAERYHLNADVLSEQLS
jgi:hypothetical protein